MLRDQVRRTKKTRPRPSPKRPVGAVNRSRPTITTAKRKLTRRSDMMRHSIPIKNNRVFTIVIALLLFFSLWYGIGHIFSFLTRTSSNQVTVVLSQPTGSDQIGNVWLLVEGKTTTPHYFLLDIDSELTNGMTTGLSWSNLAPAFAIAQTPLERRTLVSQSLGLPITRILTLTTTAGSWDAVVKDLQRVTINALRQGDVKNPAIRLWMVARMSEGETTPTPIAEIITTLARRNLSLISGTKNCPVAVLNNSVKPGFASLVGNVIERNGGTVLRIANALAVGEADPLAESATQLMIKPGEREQCAETVAAISQLLPMAVLGENAQSTSYYRASMVLVLGSDAQILPATEDAPNPHQ